jgi:hypothetical protein
MHSSAAPAIAAVKNPFCPCNRFDHNPVNAARHHIARQSRTTRQITATYAANVDPRNTISAARYGMRDSGSTSR